MVHRYKIWRYVEIYSFYGYCYASLVSRNGACDWIITPRYLRFRSI